MCCRSFHWSGGTVTVVKHKMWHFVQECQHVSAISLTSKRQKITNMLVSFKQHHILISAACCLIVPFSHNGCLAEFCIYQAINCHNIHFLYSCLIYLYVVLNAETFSKNSYCWRCGNTKNYTISLITSFLFFSHLTVWHSWHVDWDDVHWKNTWRTQLISGLW